MLIRIDHSTLVNSANNIKSHYENQDQQMRIADSAVKSMLLNDWKGEDARAFAEKWGQVDKNGSVTTQLRQSLENFEKALRSCANEYKTAQEDSYNEAYHLLHLI